MIEEVINNITSAENEAEEIVNIASKQAKDVRLKAEYECEIIAKSASEDVKRAIKLRESNAEVAAGRKTEIIFREGNKEIADYMAVCEKKTDEAVNIVTEKLLNKYGNR